MANGERLTTNYGGIRRDVLRLTAWMPNAFASYEFDENTGDDLESFKSNTCEGCDYYFDTYNDDDPRTEDSDGNEAISVTYRSRCPCYRDGIEDVSFPCAAGHDEPEGLSWHAWRYGDLPPMAFAIDLHPKIGFCHSISAWMQSADPEQQLISDQWQSINCYDTDLVCWGNDNDTPSSLPEAVATYGDSICNDDLLSPSEFLSNCSIVRRRTPIHAVKGAVIGGGFTAALLVHAAEHPAAYLLLRGSGHDASGGVILAGLQQHSEGGIDGFITQANSRGLCWFITYAKDMPDADNNLQAVLLGQIPHPLATSPCSSPAPSSSAPVAVAAS